MKKLLTVSIRRHTNKDKVGNATKYGLKKARELGKSIPKGQVLKGYSSSVERCIDTLTNLEKGFKINGKSAIGKQPVRASLREENVFRDVNKVRELFAQMGGDERKFMKLWYEGKIPKEYMVTPPELADIIVKDRFAYILRFIDLKSKNKIGKLDNLPQLHIENITHDLRVGALFERLTGKNLQVYSKQLIIKPRESIDFDIYMQKNKKLKIILNFRNNKFDVTNKINEILSS